MAETKPKKNIVWIASYPKSGNTWFRIFLSNLLSDQNVPIHINNLFGHGISTLRSLIDEVIGFDSSFLTCEEIDDLKPDIYNHIASKTNETLYIKTHEAYTLTRQNRPVFPVEATKGIIYIIRNPLDMAASIAQHYGVDMDIAVSKINENNFIFRKEQQQYMDQSAEKILSWRQHVQSWIFNGNTPVQILRYEDLLNDPVSFFSEAAGFLDINHTREQVVKAVKFSHFDILKKQEMEDGFKEKPATGQRLFFRRGTAGSYTKELSPSQVEKIINLNKPLMRKFGYLE